MTKKGKTLTLLIVIFLIFIQLIIPVKAEIDFHVGTIESSVRVLKNDGEYGEWKNITATKMPRLNDIFQVRINISTNQKCNISYGFHLECNDTVISNEDYKVFTCLDDGYEVGNWIQVFFLPAGFSNTRIWTIKQIKNSSDVLNCGLRFIIHYYNKTIVDSFEEFTILSYSHNQSDFEYGINVTNNNSVNGDNGDNNTTNNNITNGENKETPGFEFIFLLSFILFTIVLIRYKKR